MPSFCNNQLIITGPHETLQKFKELAKEFQQDSDGGHLNAFSINKFLPMPEAIQNLPILLGSQIVKAATMTAKHGYPDQDTWAKDVWGTEWGTFDSTLVRDDTAVNEIEYHYKTASTPLSERALEKVSEQFPDLSFNITSSWYSSTLIRQSHLDTTTDPSRSQAAEETDETGIN